ncbi:hypothetical protein OS493_005398 [Desmophyllum pertusum]|uniref:PPPDE domain-containing protein n=1 Tax=Desmophyllum pertusum TaxID=174260 RepID=A0A9X0CP74_9CNID|nr:hypothetical protein OS493_005398 [Desmophyllum pertusum]
MALPIKAVCIGVILSGLHCSNGGGASGKEKQFCGMFKFYCPRTNQCFDRKERCTGKVCLDAKGKEDKCYESRVAGMYKEHQVRSTGRVKVATSMQMGISSCTRDEVLNFINKALDLKYKLCSNNCQDFARELMNFLASNCTANIEHLLKALKCQFNSSFHWKFNVLLSLLIAFVIFHNIT